MDITDLLIAFVATGTALAVGFVVLHVIPAIIVHLVRKVRG